MKKIALLLTAAFVSFSTMAAIFDGNKTKVERDELPQEVIQTLEESEYRLWEIQEAYRVEDEQTNEVHYELHMASYTAADQVKNIIFSEDGQIIREEESDLGRTEDQQFEQPGTEPGFEGTDPGLEGADPEIEEPGTQPEIPGQQY
jgi:hypothetical protein